MKIKNTIFLLLIILLIFPLISCSKSKIEGSVSLKEVSLMEIIHATGKKINYTAEKNQKQIEEFIIAYNEAKPYDNNVGTTPNSEIIISLSNGDKISISGGTQGFQTVQLNGKHLNIKGDKLWDYFKKLNNQFST